MQSLKKILFAALLLGGLNAFADVQDRHLSGFHAINASGSFDIYITQGSSESVKVEAPEEILDHIITEVKGDELTIRTKNGHFNWSDLFNGKHRKVAIYVNIKSIHGIDISGSGDVYFKEGINAPRLDLSLSGSGDVSGKVDTRNLNAKASGSGDIHLSGRADQANISLSGSGDFRAGDLHTVTTMVRTTGSGDASVYASDRLDAVVSGSGDVRYSGSPKHVLKSKSGSGDIHGS